MKKIIACLLSLIFVFAVTSIAWAEDSDNETMVVNKSDIPKSVLTKLEQKEKIETASAYVGIGKEVGTAVNDSLKAVTKNAADLASTRLGHWLMFIIVFKLFGNIVLHTFIGLIFFITFTWFLIWSYKKNCMVRSVLKRILPDKTREYQIIDPKESSEFENIYWTHVVGFIIIIIVSILILLAY